MSDNSNAFWLAVGTVVVYVAALTVGLRLLYYLAYVLAAVLTCAYIWSQISKRGLSLSREVTPSQTQVGQVIQETVEIQNLSWMRKLWLEVRDQSTLPGHRVGAVVSLKGHTQKRWRVRTRCIHRGLYRLGPTTVVTGDPFGLFQSSRVFNDTAELLVFPPTVPLASFGLPSTELPGGNQTAGRSYHSTPNAAGIREYFPGDPMNRIHWSVSARAQKLMVKEFELDPTADIWLILDLQDSVHVAYEPEETEGDSTQAMRIPGVLLRKSVAGAEPEADNLRVPLDPSTEEYSVSVTASLAAYFISEGRSVGLVAWGQHKVTIPADRGGRQLVKILRALAVLRAEGDTPVGELIAAESRLFSRQDTLVVVTPSLDEGWLASLQSQLRKGLRAAAVVIESETFGGEGNALMMVSALAGMDVPNYLVKREDSIDAALGQQYSPAGVRHLR